MRRGIGTTITFGILLVAALAVAATGPAAAADGQRIEKDDQKIEKKVRVEVVGDDGGAHSMVFVNADGEGEVLHGEHPVVWVGRDGYGFRFGSGTFLGVEMTRLTPELRSHFGVAEDRGVLVARVVEDSPAARAGIQVGDILTAVDGGSIDSTGSLVQAISSREEGDRVRVEVWRDGHPLELEATLAKRQPLEGGPMGRAMKLLCDEDEEGCEPMHRLHTRRLYSEDLCADETDCEVYVQCHEDGCTCKVNGETVDCPESDD